MKDDELRLAGLTDDGTKLVLVGPDGAEFTLPADDALRAALRRGARTGELETKMESTLRPRDIQARIRSGESPEAVAAAAQTSVDKIMGFAMPVLAERAHIAERAQRASLRRRGGEGSSRVLAEAVAAQLRAAEVDPATVDWDAWRRDDGRWTLVADYRGSAGARRAEFVFDAPGRYVVAENDEARVLTGEQPAPATGGARTGRRLSAVGPADEELPLGEDAIGLVHDPATAATAASRSADRAHGADRGDNADRADGMGDAGDAGDAERTLDLTRTAGALRAVRPDAERSASAPAEAGAATGDADWMATQASERPAAPHGTPAARDDEAGSADAPPPAAGDPGAAQVAGDSAEAGEQDAGPRRPARKTRGRASVPSWDEIMFGGGRRD